MWANTLRLVIDLNSIDRIKVKSILLNALNRQFNGKRVLYVEKLGYGYKLDIVIMFREINYSSNFIRCL